MWGIWSWHILRYCATIGFQVFRKNHENLVRIVTGWDWSCMSQIRARHVTSVPMHILFFSQFRKPTHMTRTILLFVLVDFSSLKSVFFYTEWQWNTCCICNMQWYSCSYTKSSYLPIQHPRFCHSNSVQKFLLTICFIFKDMMNIGIFLTWFTCFSFGTTEWWFSWETFNSWRTWVTMWTLKQYSTSKSWDYN